GLPAEGGLLIAGRGGQVLRRLGDLRSLAGDERTEGCCEDQAPTDHVGAPGRGKTGIRLVPPNPPWTEALLGSVIVRVVLPHPPIEPPAVEARFPEPKEGEDIVAVSRSLSPGLVLMAYREGIFPWPVKQGLVPWASPDPRAVFPLHPVGPWPRTVRRAAQGYSVTIDEAFEEVMRACGDRPGEGTWITPDILATYGELYRLGW